MEKIELSSNIVLDGSKANRFQSLYATQVMGSFFGLYGKFEMSDIKDGSRTLMQIEFLGLTYKGYVNIGIKRVAQPVVRKVNGLNVISMDFEIGIHTDGSRSSYTLDIDLQNQPSCSTGDYLRLNRTYTGFGIDQPFSNGIFDEENFVRDGAYVRKRPAVDFVEADNIYSDDLGMPTGGGALETEKEMLYPTLKCIPAEHKLFVI